MDILEAQGSGTAAATGDPCTIPSLQFIIRPFRFVCFFGSMVAPGSDACSGKKRVETWELWWQIDQQAAGSLRKQERQVVEAPTRSTIDEHGSRDGLKNHNTSLLQTPKKERHEVLSGGKARQSEMLLQAQGPPGSRRNIPGSGSTKPAPVTQDWTELLGSGELVPPAASSSVARSSSSVGSSSEHTVAAVHPTLKGAAGQRSSQNAGKLCLKSELL
jgi:hypothetical protein